MSAASITSDATVLQSVSKFSYQVTWSGTSPVGTLALQVSNTYTLNPDGTVGSTGSWNTCPVDVSGTGSTTSISISGNTGKGFIDCTVNAGYAVRLVYTKVSGTGTLQATIVGKVS